MGAVADVVRFAIRNFGCYPGQIFVEILGYELCINCNVYSKSSAFYFIAVAICEFPHCWINKGLSHLNAY